MALNPIDQLFGTEGSNSPVDQLFSNKTSGSPVDQLFAKQETPVTEPPVVPKYSGISENAFSYMNLIKNEVYPTAVPYRTNVQPYTPRKQTEKVKKSFTDSLSDLVTLLGHPQEVTRGVADFLLSSPGFMVGMLRSANEIGDRITGKIFRGEDYTLEEIYDMASEQFTEGMRPYEGMKRAIVGEPTEESKLAVETLMAPMTIVGDFFRKLSNAETFKDSPNIRGALKFAGDIVGLAVFGVIAKKGKAAFEEVNNVAKGAAEIVKAEQTLAEQVSDGSMDAKMAEIQKKVLALKKERLENIAKDISKDFENDTLIKEELGRKAEQVAQEKALPISKTGLKKPKKAVQQKQVESPEVKTQKSKEIETVKEEPSPTDDFINTEVDLSGENSPFFQNKETTDIYQKLYTERAKAVSEDPELFTQKLINDVNRWYHGDETVDINKVRNTLSELAARGDELRGDFMTGTDHLMWKEAVSEAAAWARRTNKGETRVSPSVIRRRGSSTNQLNMMIPIDQVPDIVRDAIKGIKGLFNRSKTLTINDLYRNKEIFNKTGYWLGRDGKWRYELTPDYDSFHPEALKDTGIPIPVTSFYSDKAVYDAVPGLNKTRIIVREPSNDVSATYDFTNDIISIPKEGPLDTFLHEFQHAINRKTNTQAGGSTAHIVSKTIVDRIEQLIPYIKDDSDKEDALSLLKEFREKENKGLSPTLTRQYMANLIEYFDTYGYMLGLTDEQISSLSWPIDKRLVYKQYRTIPGEMEARLVETRMHMLPETRKAIPPWESLDRMLKNEDKSSDLRMSEVYTGKGTRLYDIGGATVEGVRQIIEGAKKISEYTKKARGMKSFKPLDAAKIVKEEFIRSFVDRSGNIRKEMIDRLGPAGYEAAMKMYLSKGASSISANMLKQMQKEVYGGLTKQEKTVLDNLILAERMVDIGSYKSKFKFPEEIKPENSIAYLELFDRIEKLSPERAEILRNRAKGYFEWMKKPLKDMLDNDLISQQEYDNLASHNYRRLKLVDIYDKRYGTKLGKKMKTVYDSGVEALARGRDTDIFEPSSEVMALEVFNRAYGRIMNNKANQNLLAVARNVPDNPFVRVRTKENPIPSGWSRIFTYEEGKREAIYLSPEMSKEWITNSPEVSYRLSQLIRFASGSSVLRTFATGINWGFALANLPRDVMHAWFSARSLENGEWKSVYNPVLPVYGLQIGRDLASVFMDSVTRGKRYQDYIKQGGGMEFLVHQGRLFQRGRHLESPLDKVQNFMGYFGETSEIMTRLAIRERAIRQGKSPEEATFIARDYMDFGQGGSISKALDNGIPYLNAAIQGTRGLFRAFKDSPFESSFKLAQISALTTGIYIASKKDSPETMKQLQGSIDMQNNLCIPLGDSFGFYDEKGQKRYPYIKVPLDPGQKFFKTFFEASADKWLGNEVDVNRVVDSLKQMSPASVTELPPTLSGALGYITNKDFWLNEDIWRSDIGSFDYQLPKRLTGKQYGGSEEEYIPGQTPQAYVDFGKATGLSPERTRYAVEELLTNGTVWSHLLNIGYEKAFGDLPESDKQQHLAMALAKTPIFKRFIGVTNPHSQYANDIDTANQESTIERFVQNRELDRLVNGFLYEGTVKESEIGKYINSFKDPKIADRLFEREEFGKSIKDLPNRSFWLSMKGLNTEARARVFVNTLNKSNPTERKELYSELGRAELVGHIVTDGFLDEIGKLKAEQ